MLVFKLGLERQFIHLRVNVDVKMGGGTKIVQVLDRSTVFHVDFCLTGYREIEMLKLCS